MTMDNISVMCRNLCYVASEHESDILYLLLLMVLSMYKYMGKVVIELLQGSAITQTVFGGLTIHPAVANFL